MYELLINLHHIVTLVFETLYFSYQIFLFVGALGLAAQAALGFLHAGPTHSNVHSGGHATNGNGHTGHAPAPAAHAGQPAHHTPAAHHNANGHQSHTNPHGAREGRMGDAGTKIFALLSPLMIFSVCLGIGGLGLLLRSFLQDPILTGILALAGGFAFYRWGVRPLMTFILGFASRPAQNLSGAVATEAEAMSRFDAQGRGMARVVIDGEVKRLLAYLEKEDVQKGVAVSTGDRLLVMDVDVQKNTCRVTRL